jgi:CRP-like cAMP-binding protein
MAQGSDQGFLELLGAEARAQALARSRTIRARQGQAVVAKGDNSTEVFLVQEGRLQVVLYSAAGREVLLRDLMTGDMFGELGAIDGRSRSVSIVAASDVRLLALGRQAFNAALKASPEAMDWMLHRLVTQVKGLTDRVFELSALDVQARLHCELLRLAKASPSGLSIDPAPTHAELANRIGSHREAVTRELGSLAERNIVRSGRRWLEILDIDRLQQEVRLTHAASPEEGW